MIANQFLHLGRLHSVEEFRSHLKLLELSIPCDLEVESGADSPLGGPIRCDEFHIGNRFAIQPMEGWDGTSDGRPTELTFRRWRNFGASGAKLIWGGEAVAVRHDGRANPHQLLINKGSRDELARLRDALAESHRVSTGSTDGFLVGLQLTHSGRYSRPNSQQKSEPRILYRHPLLDQRLGLPLDYPLLSDDEIREIIEDFHQAARLAQVAGFDFVDIKHCHGYLGHEFLSAHTRPGAYGGSFENRTRFLCEVVDGIRALAPGLHLGVRVSAWDTVPFRPDPSRSVPGRPGPGVPDSHKTLLPYRWGFGVDVNDPVAPDLTETTRFLMLLQQLNIRLVNISAGSPYYNPHVQRPALYPPSDGYLPPEEPLVGVARHLQTVRTLKKQFPDLVIVGSAYTYLQDFLPNVAQALVREGWVDSVGLGRLVLSYPGMPLDILQGNVRDRRRVCRTFSDCTTAPRNSLPSGCYPLDDFYKTSPAATQLKQLKRGSRQLNNGEKGPVDES